MNNYYDHDYAMIFVLVSCSIKEGAFYDVPVEQLLSYSIIVTTTMTSRVLSLSGLRKGFFTHIFIDEAAQVGRERGGGEEEEEEEVLMTTYLYSFFD